MQKSVKALVLITTSCLLSFCSMAQLKLPVINGIAADVKKVLDDYPSRFSNLTGEMITENPQSVDYACNFSFTGAENTMITKYSSAGKNVSSFEALMLTTESFEKAKQKFHAICNQLNNMPAAAGSLGSFKLKGEYKAPVEEKKFASVVYLPAPGSVALKKLRVEVFLEADQMEWKVRLLVYDRDREDQERGETRE